MKHILPTVLPKSRCAFIFIFHSSFVTVMCIMVRIIIVITHEFNGLALETQPINIMKCKHITMYIARAIKKKNYLYYGFIEHY